MALNVWATEEQENQPVESPLATPLVGLPPRPSMQGLGHPAVLSCPAPVGIRTLWRVHCVKLRAEWLGDFVSLSCIRGRPGKAVRRGSRPGKCARPTVSSRLRQLLNLYVPELNRVPVTREAEVPALEILAGVGGVGHELFDLGDIAVEDH